MPVSKRVEQPAPVQTNKLYWTSDCGRAVVYVGDNVEVMAKMEPNLFHAVVTDPPYGLEFMGKEWDAPWKNNGSVDAREARNGEMTQENKRRFIASGVTFGTSDSAKFQSWFLDRAIEILRVSKPGAHLLSFGGTRMWHRMACAVEDAGWEIRDTIMWVYGSGFPKGQNVSLAIDKTLGATREVVGSRSGLVGGGFGNVGHCLSSSDNAVPITEPATEAARQWSGWNTALKPSVEPVVVARKPIPSTVAKCVLEHGTGAMNIDGCRVGTTGEDVTREIQSYSCSGSGCYAFNSGEAGSQSMQGGFTKTHKDGRWPANLITDGSDEVVELFPDNDKPKKERIGPVGGHKGTGNVVEFCSSKDAGKHIGWWPGDEGGSAARFFYTAKANDDDRPHGKGAVSHPTVKPLDLMRYLVRLVCAKGGMVLDPFMGSGSTGCAAVMEGMKFVGIEQSVEYADIAIGRIKLALQKAPGMVELKTYGAPPAKLRGA